MALTDILTDGTDSISFANAFDGFTDKYSYKQQLVEKNALGEYPEVTERMQMNWNAEDDEARGVQHATLMRLKRKANKWGDKDYREGPVWRELRSNSEAAPKYMVVTNVHIVELDAEFYGPDGTSKGVVMEITREGAPRLISPEASALYWLSKTLYDYNVGEDNNWITISLPVDPEIPIIGFPTYDLIPGDADAILKFKLDIEDDVSQAYRKHNQITIAKRTAATYEGLDGFKTHLNPVDILSGDLTPGVSLVTDATVPGGKMLRIDNDTPLYEVNINVFWRTDGAGYEGNFAMIIPINTVAANDYCHITPMYGLNSDWVYGQELYVPAGYHLDGFSNPLYQKFYAGMLSLPHHADVTTTDVWIGFKIRMPPSSNFNVRGVWLIPLDEGVFTLRDISHPTTLPEPTVLIVDGEKKQSIAQYGTTSTYPRSPEVGGRYLTADHQKYTRFYFFKSYWDYDKGIDAIYPGLLNYEASIDVIPRCAGIAAGI